MQKLTLDLDTLNVVSLQASDPADPQWSITVTKPTAEPSYCCDTGQAMCW
ncbi:hypothetical protein [Longimicrobium sp.]|nr:hypothetical protein [Longimicrobium sp.]HSU16620.1 hypothetical protein [Longimicrobium sp.]